MSTICAPATATGGAISIIRVSGPDSIRIVDSLFHGRHSLIDAPGYSLHYGTFHRDNNVSSSPSSYIPHDVIDDVLVSVFRAPHSYTGEDSIEISCHGSSYITKTILTILCQQGCRIAHPGEFTRRAFMNGKMDLSQAEAVADLIASTNEATHRVAMTQMRGGFSSKLSALRTQLLEMTSLLELELDFSEEDVEFADRQKLINLGHQIDQEITALSASFNEGNVIKTGIPVAIIGAPNVGKSTLLNKLLHDDRAIVSEIQGTTRDVIEDTIYISQNDNLEQTTHRGALFRFIDTAGIRNTDDAIEQMGIERSIKAAEKAHIIILMAEPGVDFPDVTFRNDQTVIRIINKTNEFQALTGKGLENLHSQLLDSVPKLPEDAVIITNIRHKQILDLAHLDIQRSLNSLDLQLSGDLIAEDLRQCIYHLGEITGGTISTDEVLGNIFKQFCIGK